ncbi:MAG: hypothetical protein FWG52_05330 [Proteobacteria bacterium]|nr:hypothetical protein [Pseudomonadota bacterium]
MDGISFKRASRQFAIRDRLASALKPHIGTFDHAEMTLSEIGALGCKRLGIKSRKGYELHTLQGYFAAKRTAGTMDSASNPNSAVNLYLKGIHRPFKGSMVDKYIHGGT